jgi:predicted amidohydrolase
MVEQSNSSLKVAAIQMVSTPNWAENLERAAYLVTKAAEAQAKFVLLPEFFIQITASTDSSRFDIAEELGHGPIQKRLALIAREAQVYLLAGTLMIKDPVSRKFFNSSILYSPDGSMLCHYKKIHLFKFDDGTHNYDESATFVAGSEIVTVDIESFKVGLSVCYDLRFPELFRKMGVVDVVVLPSAFTYVTGKAHWEILSRARAIENQCYFVALNQGGEHLSGRKTYGHTMVIDPWGNKVSECELGECIVYATLEKSVIKNVRVSLPVLEHRRL